MNLEKLLNKVAWILAVVCNQWGDTGKGKFIDYFASWADVVARGTGGANAGHTVKTGNIEFISHLIPSGILHDKNGKINVIGSGTVLDPRILCEELAQLRENGLRYDHLMIALNAKLVLPQHLLLDRIKESDSGRVKIGTTGRGIGPCYTDHYARTGLIMNDLLNKDVFVKKLERNLREKVRILKTYDPELVEKIMSHEHLENGIYYDPADIIDVDAIVEKYCNVYGKELEGMIRDTDEFMQRSAGKKRILLEGAQGLLLSIDYGSFPYVTSSDPSVRGLAKGVGLSEKQVDLTLGIVKAFYMTRVGGGPFPTEMGGAKSEEWCNGDGNRNFENSLPVTVNDRDEFHQGIAIRIAGNEYGATTGRPRRTGWLDLPLLRYAIGINGPDVILTKLDVLSGCERIKLCRAYRYEGPDYRLGEKTIKTGDVFETAIPQTEVLQFCRPIYTEFGGWQQDIRGAKTLEGLPDRLKEILDYVKKETGIVPRILSVGPDREETIVL